MKKILLLILLAPLAWASYINFGMYSLSNLFGGPIEYLWLISLTAGLIGFIILVFARTRRLQQIGVVGVLVSLGSALFAYFRAFLGY